MCEPRRVHITIARQVREAWEREISRIAQAERLVTGEARIMQPIDASVGVSALLALRAALSRGVVGWRAEGDGYRHEVDGGYVFFDPALATLEIVAVMSETVIGSATVAERLGGVVDEEIAAEGVGRYYHDNWGGHTRERAEAEAQGEAERSLSDALRARVDEQAACAERSRAAALAAAADSKARSAAEEAATSRQVVLNARAAERLREVGARARLSFNRLLAGAYRDALIALARRRGVSADGIRHSDTGDRLELEFVLPD